jgi:hypothetical protein
VLIYQCFMVKCWSNYNSSWILPQTKRYDWLQTFGKNFKQMIHDSLQIPNYCDLFFSLRVPSSIEFGVWRETQWGGEEQHDSILPWEALVGSGQIVGHMTASDVMNINVPAFFSGWKEMSLHSKPLKELQVWPSW